MLVVVEDRDVQRVVQPRLDLEAAGGGDVLQVDAAEGRSDADDRLDDLVGVLGVQADGERVHAAEGLEQSGFALHDRHGGLRADIAQTQDRAAVGDDGHRVRLQRVVVGRLGVLGDDLAGLGDPGGVGHGQIVARGDVHLRIEGELAAPFGVLGERFRCDIHRFQVLRTISPV